jgi:hypothetical protein
VNQEFTAQVRLHRASIITPTLWLLSHLHQCILLSNIVWNAQRALTAYALSTFACAAMHVNFYPAASTPLTECLTTRHCSAAVVRHG